MHHNMHWSMLRILLGTLLKPLSWVVLVNWATHFALLYPYGESLGFPMMSSLHHITSWQSSSHFEWIIQSAAFLPRHTHACVHESQNIPLFPHSSSRFWRGNILDASFTLYFGIPQITVYYPLLHLCIHGNCVCISHITCFIFSHACTIINLIY